MPSQKSGLPLHKWVKPRRHALASLHKPISSFQLIIALANIGKPSAAAIYFDQSIIVRSLYSSSGGDTGLGDSQPEPVK